MNNFRIYNPSLEDILKDVGCGNIQLPVFQRQWVWDDYHIRSLIGSVSLSFPIGAVLTLKAGGEEIRFKTRLFNGIESLDDQIEPDTLILDGQQRLTALYQSLLSGKAVSTYNAKGTEILRFYYLDMKACIENVIEREEAVLSCGEDYQLHKADGESVQLTQPGNLFSTAEEEYKNMVFPVSKIFNYDDWLMEYQDYWEYNKDKTKFFNKFRREVIRSFTEYQVPVIEIPSETPKEAICLVFEKVNTRGVTLTVFELLTATFAIDDYDLREDWEIRSERMKEKYKVLEELESTNFLRALTLLVTNAKPETSISCTRRDILRLTLEDYKNWADQTELGFIEAARFLHRQKIFKAGDLPYQTQIVPLAAILANLEDIGNREKVRQKIARWYWCGVLGEMYGAATDTRFANDLSEVTGWVKGESSEPRTIREAGFHENRLAQLRTRNGAAYKGVHALVMHERGGMKCRDFRSEIPIDEKIYFDDNIDIHHIFPQKWCEEHSIQRDKYNCIINKTALSSSTNRMIGGGAPSEYLLKIQQDAGRKNEGMDEILASHLILADFLRENDFWGFFDARKDALLNAIKKAMGKEVIREGDDLSDSPA